MNPGDGLAVDGRRRRRCPRRAIRSCAPSHLVALTWASRRDDLVLVTALRVERVEFIEHWLGALLPGKPLSSCGFLPIYSLGNKATFCG